MTTREEDSFELMLCINMIHISSWSATIGLMKLAQRKLSSQDGILYCYGPFLEHGTSVPTNL